MKRRDFIKWSVALTGVLPVMEACTRKTKIPGRIIGASSATGHLLRDKHFGAPEEVAEQEVVIIGGGVSGLSAARYLTEKGIRNIALLDIEQKPGGNAASGANSVSLYPWGAHYIPLPNNSLTEYLSFLQDCNVITGYDDKGLPVYNEYHLCQDPEERLYINGIWQDGLVPRAGLNNKELEEFSRFFAMMQEYRDASGNDGKDAFAIPVDQSSRDDKFVALDNITMKDWMMQQHFNNEYIKWYVDYCTRDDFGTTYDKISAWAGIHYFASRKGKGSNASYHDVLTWEQGNGFLVAQLLKQSEATLLNQCVAVSVQGSDHGVQVNYYDVMQKKLKGIKAKHCIMAVPQFAAARLLKDDERIGKVRSVMSYVPWMVANMTVAEIFERSGAPPSWDNVIYGSEGLGYVDATHQQVQQYKPKRNLTYYIPLTIGNPSEARKRAMNTTHEEWVKQVIDDLNLVHPGIEQQIEQMDIMIWGHAMAQPLPGMIFGGERKELGRSLEGKIHFAHTDIAGISIFEEAFYKGLHAAKKIAG